MAQTAQTQVRRPTLAEARQKAESRVADITERVAGTKEKTDRLSDLGAKLQDAITRRDVNAAGLIAADYTAARAIYDADRKDLSATMYAMTQEIKGIGAAIDAVQELDQNEQKLIDDADTNVRNAEAAVAAADAARVTAQAKKWFRDSAIRAAETQKREAETGLDSARAAVEPAKLEAARLKRVRLENMDFQDSLQMLLTFSGQAAQIMKDNVADIETNLENMVVGSRELGVTMERLSREVSDGDLALARIKGELATLREQQGEFVANGPEWQAKETEIAEKNREYGEAETKRNTAYGVFQDSQRFVEVYRAQELAQQKSLEFTTMWIELLETGSAHRIGIFDSALGIVVTASNMEAAGIMDAVSVEADERVTSHAVAFTAAAAKLTMDRFHRTTEDIGRVREIRGAGATIMAKWDDDMAALLTLLNENYGSDPYYADPDHHHDAQGTPA